MREMKHKHQHLKKLINLEGHMVAPEGACETEGPGITEAWDDVTGEELGGDQVMKAREKEMSYIREKQVWDVISRREAEDKRWKVVKTRWIDIDKGDKAHKLQK